MTCSGTAAGLRGRSACAEPQHNFRKSRKIAPNDALWLLRSECIVDTLSVSRSSVGPVTLPVDSVMAGVCRARRPCSAIFSVVPFRGWPEPPSGRSSALFRRRDRPLDRHVPRLVSLRREGIGLPRCAVRAGARGPGVCSSPWKLTHRRTLFPCPAIRNRAVIRACPSSRRSRPRPCCGLHRVCRWGGDQGVVGRSTRDGTRRCRRSVRCAAWVWCPESRACPGGRSGRGGSRPVAGRPGDQS